MNIKDFKDDCDYSKFNIIYVKITALGRTKVELECETNENYVVEGVVEKDSPIMSGTYLIDLELHLKENTIKYYHKGKALS